MGIFNYVNFKTNCPNCEALMHNFQTKDGDLSMSTVEPWEVSNFYDCCENCDTWVEYKRRSKVPPKGWLEEYEVKVEQLPRKPKKEEEK